MPARCCWCLALLLCLSPAHAQESENFGLDGERIAVQVVPATQTTLAAEFSARLKALPYREGETFESGVTLAAFDCEAQRAKAERAEAQADSARATFLSNQALNELNATGRLEVDKSRAELAIAEAELRYLQVLLDKCRVPAPYDGAVGAVHAREGQFLQAGAPIMDILDHRDLQVEFIVPTRWLTWLKPGRELTVHIEDTARSYTVRLLRTARRADPLSQSIKGFAEFVASGDELLLAGMSGYLQVPAASGASEPKAR